MEVKKSASKKGLKIPIRKGIQNPNRIWRVNERKKKAILSL